MAKLIKCIECGKELSSEAYSCPHCNTRSPQGWGCFVCRKVGRKSDLTCGEYFDYAKSYSIHKSCFDEINQCKYSCPVCKNLITSHKTSSCPNCGHPLQREKCAYCGEVLIPGAAFKLSKKEVVADKVWGHDYAHKACYASRYSSSSCFIATAALGSSLAPEVKTLQTFRDNVLRKYHFGRIFIALYESVSPPFAHIIARNEVLRYLTRFLIVYPAAQLAKLTLKRNPSNDDSALQHGQSSSVDK